MQHNIIHLSGKEMQFYYFNEIHNVNVWRNPISFDYYKINFFLELDARIIINDTVYSPKRYEFLSYPLYSNHYGIIDRKQNIEYFEFLIPEHFFDSIDNEGKMTDILNEITSKKIFSLPASHQESFTEKMYALRDKLKENAESIYIIYSLLEILFDIKKYSDNPIKIPAKMLSPNLLEIIFYIEKNFTKLSTVNELSDAVHFSRAYITKLFKTEIGCTPYEYLTDLKIEHSIKLLKDGKNVTEACYESGFNSCSAYIQVFKKKLFQTPYKYKKMLGAGQVH